MLKCETCGKEHAVPSHVRSVVCSCQARVQKNGLGDWIEALLNPIGGRWFKAMYRRWFGKSCGCQRRRDSLNKWSHRIGTWIHEAIHRGVGRL